MVATLDIQTMGGLLAAVIVQNVSWLRKLFLPFLVILLNGQLATVFLISKISSCPLWEFILVVAGT